MYSDRMADTYQAIAEPTRRAILDRLRNGECSVTELVDLFPISQPGVSRHLRVLREAGLVTMRREGRTHWYGLVGEPLSEVYDWVGHYEDFWSRRLGRLHSYLEEQR